MNSMLWEIYVPCQWNNGKPIRTRHHKEWDRKVRKISGGMTIMKPGKGQWISREGKLFEERIIPVRIVCSRDEIMKIMDITAGHYKQMAVMSYLVSNEVIINEYY